MTQTSKIVSFSIGGETGRGICTYAHLDCGCVISDPGWKPQSIFRYDEVGSEWLHQCQQNRSAA